MDNKRIVFHINKVLDRMNVETRVSENGVCSRSICLPVRFKSEKDWFIRSFKKVNNSHAEQNNKNEVVGGGFTIYEGKYQYTVYYTPAKYIGKSDRISYYCEWTDEWRGKQVRKKNLKELLAHYTERYKSTTGLIKFDYAECIQGVIKELDNLMATM